MHGEEVFRNADILVRAVRGFGPEACVVTFDSYSDYRTLDRAGFGEDFFRKGGIDAIHVIGRDNDWYQYREFPAVAARIAHITRSYHRVIAYGSSMGGYAAIRFGGMVGARAAVALSPQFSLDPAVVPFENRWSVDAGRLDFTLERTLEAPFVATSYVAYDPYDPDRQHVALFRARTELIELKIPHGGHPVTGYLAEADLLGPLVRDAAFGRLDAAQFCRQARAARKSVPQFFQTLSQRARRPETQIALARQAVALGPDNVSHLIQLGHVLATHRRFDEAQQAFARATALAPDYPPLAYRLSELGERRGDFNAALATMEALVARHADAAIYQPRLRYLEEMRQMLETPPAPEPAIEAPAAPPAQAETRLRRLARFLGWERKPRGLFFFPPFGGRPVDVEVTTTPSPPPFVHSWQRHAELMRRLPREPVDLWLVGDSLVHYWPDQLWAPWRVFNFGIAADKTQHALWRVLQLPPASIAARHVLVMLGTNNLGADDTARGIAAGIAQVVAAVRQVAPGATVQVVAPPPCGPGFQFRAAVRREAIGLLNYARSFETIDVDHALTDGFAAASPHYQEDCIHFSDSGYRLLTEIVRSRIDGPAAAPVAEPIAEAQPAPLPAEPVID